MTKQYSRFLTAFFCLFLGGLLVWHVVAPDRERSDVENRTLEQWPEFSWESLKSGAYTEAVEAYFADQFPLRDSWTGLKGRVEQGIGKMEFNNVYLCGDTLISKVETPDQALLEKNLEYLRRFGENCEIPVWLGMIPSAAEIWKDRLPAGADTWDQTQLLETVGEATGLPTIDFWSALEARRDEPIFYRTDHHWTTLGASVGAECIFDAFGTESVEQEEYTVECASDAFYGTLYSTSGIHWLEPDTMEYWVDEDSLTVTSWRNGTPEASPLYDRTYLEKKDKYSSFLGGNQPLCVIENENLPEGEKILVIRDSYADALAPLLAQRYAEVHLVDLRYYRAPVRQYAQENEIDRILVLYSVQNFVSDRNLVLLTQ